MDQRSVVTGFLRNDGDVLLLQRSEDVGSYRGKWAAVSGYAEGDPDSQIEREIREETGLDPESDCQLLTAGDPFEVVDEDLGRTWRIHPYLFDCTHRAVQTDWESTEFEWVSPTKILDRETVPDLWRSYDRVRPTVVTVASDSTHGSAYISLRALEVLRDEAALLARGRESEYDSVEAVGSELLAARPAMTVVRNRVNRVLSKGSTVEPAEVESNARDAIKSAIEADRGAATTLGAAITDKRVATLSRSGTVLAAIDEGEPGAVLLAESRPGSEGTEVAEQLSSELDVTLTSDAAFPHTLVEWEADCFVVGADTVFSDGCLINKVGTRPGALSATDADVPVLVGTATDKISHERTIDLEERAASELYDGTAPITVENPTFDLTPPSAIDQFVTERGSFDPGEIESLAAEHEQRAGWQE
ncbi:NUDIX domain-containing protein [Halobacteriaceae archaeon SHR40]|uniref:NUDIX domain-containing protein n=1 Tax=Halovenus amylolytica TaxID=2500550 RepID=UPI000FE403AB